MRDSDKQIALSNIVPSVCIISIIRLVVLSRLEAVDVTCKPLLLGTSPVKLMGLHVREFCGRRNLVSGRTCDGVRRAIGKRTLPAC